MIKKARVFPHPFVSSNLPSREGWFTQQTFDSPLHILASSFFFYAFFVLSVKSYKCGELI